MMKEDAVEYYKNREFYEILNQENGTILLAGPLDTVRKATVVGQPEDVNYPYVQVIGGKIVRAFKPGEIAEYVRES